MEAITHGSPLTYLVSTLLAGVQVVVLLAYLPQDEGALVAALEAEGLLSVRLQGVRLNNQQCLVVEARYLRRLPCQTVHVDMSIPLGADLGAPIVEERSAVEDHDDGPITFRRPSADIHHHHIPVGHLFTVGRFGQLPHPQQTIGIIYEMEVEQCLAPLLRHGQHLALHRRLTTPRTQAFHHGTVEHVGTRMLERLDIVGRELRSQVSLVGVFAPFERIPMKCLKRGPHTP